MAVNYDKKIRVHQFRKRATKYLENLSKRQLNILYSYTAGVNQGVNDLSAKPFEYWLLNKPTVVWRPEDSLLVLYSMYIDLQYEDGKRERVLGQLQANLMPDVFAFLTPKGSKWDAALDNTNYSPPPIPDNGFELAPVLNLLSSAPNQFKLFDSDHEANVGSNNWAVSGDVSTTGSAIVADDMHLGLGVPNIWYRASFRYQEDGKKIRVDGVTLPGTPAMVVGSNHHVAWGFTNSYGDWNDVVRLKLNDKGDKYMTPNGFQSFDVETEVILVSGQPAQEVEIKKTIWGPVIGRDHDGTYLALRWVAHDKEGINFNMLQLELSEDIEQSMDIAARSGIPAQNMVTGDKFGNIGWTIAGAIPRKFGASNSTRLGWSIPQDWSKGQLGWNGYLEPDEYPRVTNPKQDRVWTANSRVVGGRDLELIGNGGYALGARSQQIRDSLQSKSTFSEQDLLNIQNDDRAIFLTRWHQFLLDDVLNYDFVQAEDLSDLMLHLQNWQQRASVDSVGYLFVRTFRLNIRNALFAKLEESIQSNAMLSDVSFSLRPIRHQLEIPMWQMINEQPEHLLPEPYQSWPTFFQQMVRQTLEELTTKYGTLDEATWGAHNTLKIQHPMSKAIPALGWLLDMSAAQASGDSYMPRVQGRGFGASQRLVVSPGFEQNGILHMPSGQSGHPLSPYYGTGHKDWIEGISSPLLPGVTKHKLFFVPQ